MSSSGNKPNIELLVYRIEQLEKEVEKLNKSDQKLNDTLNGRETKKLSIIIGAFITVLTGSVLYVVQMLISNVVGGK